MIAVLRFFKPNQILHFARHLHLQTQMRKNTIFCLVVWIREKLKILRQMMSRYSIKEIYKVQVVKLWKKVEQPQPRF